MKKILIIGASGNVGYELVKKLIKSNKYEITAIDLKNKKTVNKFKKIKNKINVIYGDVLNNELIDALVLGHDYVINLCAIMPPLSEFNKSATENIIYNGNKIIVNAIKNKNSNCKLIYTSTTSFYLNDDSNINSKIKCNTNYDKYNYESEEYIKKNINNYIILRTPLILNNIVADSFIYNINKNSVIDTISLIDIVYLLEKLIEYDNNTIGIYNISSNNTFRLKFNDILKSILKNYGFSFKYLFSRIFLDNYYKSPILNDSDVLNEIYDYKKDSYDKYLNRLKKIGNKRIISRIIGKIILIFKR